VLRTLQGSAPLWGGSADLAGHHDGGRRQPVLRRQPAGEFIRFGIREQAMAAILNGIALQGPWCPFASTDLGFSDYVRPTICLSAVYDYTQLEPLHSPPSEPARHRAGQYRQPTKSAERTDAGENSVAGWPGEQQDTDAECHHPKAQPPRHARPGA
jgi:hypothetical protein